MSRAGADRPWAPRRGAVAALLSGSTHQPRLSRGVKVLRRWRQRLADQVDDLEQQFSGAHRRLASLATGVVAPSSFCRDSLESLVLPGAALYLELRDHVGQERALSLTGACIADDAQRAARVVRLLDRTPWLFPVLRFLTIRRMRQAYVPPAWQARVLEDNPRRVRFDMTRCYYLDTLTTLGIPELTGSYCHTDDVLWGDLRHIEFRRAGTLGRGYDRCDFCYARREPSPRRHPQAEPTEGMRGRTATP